MARAGEADLSLLFDLFTVTQRTRRALGITMEDGLFVLNSHDPEAIGGRVTAIGGLPVDEAMAAVEPYVSRDNDMTVRIVVPIYLTCVELLQELGVLRSTSRASCS